MKLSNVFMALVASLIAGSTALALDVGQVAPCVVLDHTQKGVDSSHCIRDPQVEGRPVLIEFFSITCSDCLRNLPNIKALAKALEGQATVRFVSIDRDEKKVREYIKRHNIEIEVAFDSNRDARKAYGVIVTPTLFILDQENTIVEKHTGVLSAQDMDQIIDLVNEL